MCVLKNHKNQGSHLTFVFRLLTLLALSLSFHLREYLRKDEVDEVVIAVCVEKQADKYTHTVSQSIRQTVNLLE